MTLHESVPHQETRPRSWAARPTAVAGPRRAFREVGVVAEIKPHTAGGIRDGVRQLKARRAELGRKARDTRYHLITYRQVDGDPTRYETFISDPGTMEAVVFGSGAPTFLRMGREPIDFPAAVRTIPVHQCPTLLGNELEPRIRARYVRWMLAMQGHTVRLADKSASATGADIRHELAGFLRELALELEAEGYS